MNACNPARDQTPSRRVFLGFGGGTVCRSFPGSETVGAEKANEVARDCCSQRYRNARLCSAMIVDGENRKLGYRKHIGYQPQTRSENNVSIRSDRKVRGLSRLRSSDRPCWPLPPMLRQPKLGGDRDRSKFATCRPGWRIWVRPSCGAWALS